MSHQFFYRGLEWTIYFEAGEPATRDEPGDPGECYVDCVTSFGNEEITDMITESAMDDACDAFVKWMDKRR